MRAILIAALLAGPAPLMAQHEHHEGHAMPAPAAEPAPQPDPHAGHDMPPPAAADPHAGHAMPDAAAQPAGDPVGTNLEPGSAPAPTPPTDHYADRYWPADAMARSREQIRVEHGAMPFSRILIDMAEVQPEGDGDIYRIEGEAAFGGDINRFMLKAETEGVFSEGAEKVELQALYSRAIDAYWNLQAGVRHDFRPDPERSYAVLGVEGLAPYWFEVEGALFLSNKGDLHARIEASYDQRITQKLIAQPAIELNFAAQHVPAIGVGSGLSDAELGLRLRYEFVREFAPYVGVSIERTFGDTARYARLAGEERTSAGVVMGVRVWF